jgi:GntR family transcriptional regulator / MocR family aminotransferase
MRMPRPGAVLGTIALDRDGEVPLQRQLYAALREAILAGRLSPGTRLPASRVLARDLGAARNTVVAAFEQLVAEGYLASRVGDGTRVAAVLPETLLHARRAPVAEGARGVTPGLSRRGEALVAARRPLADPQRRAFQPGLPAVDEFPRDLWGRLLARRARAIPRSALGYGHPAGLPMLREAIAVCFGAARGVTCTPEQVIVVAGAQAGLDLCSRLLLDPGDRAWIEEPGYLGARGALLAAGASPVPVPIDADGIDVDAGARLAPAARLVYVTPSHQFPLGMTMTLDRRLRLLAWAAAAGAWVLEDDFDSEYRYSGRPVAAMQGLDVAGRVVYIGTFSKTMFPALRAGYLVVPGALVDAFTTAVRLTGQQVAGDVQAALADFLTEGHFAAHVRRMRSLYAARQERLVRALRRRLDGIVSVEPREGGMQVAAMLPADADDAGASRAAAGEGVIAPPLSMYHLGTPQHRGLHLGFAGVRDREISGGVERLARGLERWRRQSGARPGAVVRSAAR